VRRIRKRIAGVSTIDAALHQSGAARLGYDVLLSGQSKPDQAGLFHSELKAKPNMTVPNDIAGTAALAICESLLLALNDHRILPESEIVGILRDAAAAHENAPAGEEDGLHADVARLINGILAGGNSVRRP
jgi:hypothetical protein